jgi:hypothetical protein
MWHVTDPDLIKEAAELVEHKGQSAIGQIRDRLLEPDCSRSETDHLTKLLREVRKLLPLDSGLDSATRRLGGN